MDSGGDQSLVPGAPTVLVEAPRGRYSAGKLDEKGRLKMPTDFQEYLRSLPDKKLFVTSLNRRIAQIYPMDVWRENEKRLESFTADPEAARTVMFNANDLGANAEMDGQGRITFNPELRRELGLENQGVHMYAYRGRIEVMSDAVYQAQRQQHSKDPQASVDVLERAGFR